MSGPAATEVSNTVTAPLRRTTSGIARSLRWAALLALSTFWLVPHASAYAAMPAPHRQAAQPGTVEQSWALTPTGADPTQPGSRSNLSYSLAPGASFDDSVTLWNYSDDPIEFDVYATDAYNTKAGEFTLLNAGETPRDVGAWMKVGTSKITVPGKTSAQIPISLAVPAEATPGDHVGGIVATSKTPAIDNGGNQVLLDRRVGTRIYLRVDGELDPKLEVERIDTTYHDALNPLNGSVDVTYTVRNTGNVRLSARQRVEVADLFGTAASRKLDDLPELLPGNAIVLHTRLNDVAATFRITSTVRLEPFSASDAVDPKELEAFSRSEGAWAIPWTLLAIVVFLLAAAWGLAWWRKRRAARPRGPATPSTVDGSGPPSTNGGSRARPPARVG